MNVKMAKVWAVRWWDHNVRRAGVGSLSYSGSGARWFNPNDPIPAVDLDNPGAVLVGGVCSVVGAVGPVRCVCGESRLL